MRLEEVYDRFGEKMYHYLALRLGSPEDAEDVLQETFCRLAGYSVRWGLVRTPKAFVFKVVRNEANRFLGRKIRQKRLTGDQMNRAHAAAETNPQEADALVSVIEGPSDEAARLVSRALSRLPDDQKEIIILKIFQEFTFKEIASLSGLSINTVASRYRYGIEKLRSILEGKA
jgi:RNA polymerase sigma-70 factor (ECF subfamily)